jgi:pyridoxal phosphate-dependent aminotransferase EpsN
MKNRIFLSPPHMTKKEEEFLLDAFNSNWIAPLGPHVNLFEEEMSNFLKIKSSCALSSGTAALHLALKVLGIAKDDFVLCSSLTFAASANAILYEGAIPIFLDSNQSTWNLDIDTLENAIKRYKPKALIAVDLYGQSCDYESISNLCEQSNIKLIEDSAEALGSEYKKNKCGTFGDIGILSFNGNKIITTSGGGMLVSNNKEYVDKSRFLASQSKEKEIHYEHKELGYNYRLSNLLAALGRAQLSNLDSFVKKRRDVYERYFNALSSFEGIQFMKEAPNVMSNRWLTTLTIDPSIIGKNRDEIIIALEKNNIEARPVWKPMHMQPLYKKYNYVSNNTIDISRDLFKNGLCLPSGSNLSKQNQDKVIDIVISTIGF